MSHSRDGREQRTSQENIPTPMAATISSLPGIRDEQMRGPADVQRLPSLNELFTDIPWQPDSSRTQYGSLNVEPRGPTAGLTGRPSIPLSPNPSTRHRDTFSSTPAPVQLSPQRGHPSPASSSRSSTNVLPPVHSIESRGPFGPQASAQSRDPTTYAPPPGSSPNTFYNPPPYGSREPSYGGHGQAVSGPVNYGPPSQSPYSAYLDDGSVGGRGASDRRRRGNLPKQVTDILRMWFQDHVAHPYPTEEEKQQLMHQTGLTISQISNWFINARRRSLPRMAGQSGTDTDLP